MQCYSLTPAGVVRSSLRRAAAGEGAEAQPGEVLGAWRRGQWRWGASSAVRRRGDVFLGACRRRRRRGGLQLCQLRAAWGATGQLSGIWLGLWESASGGAAQSASMFTWHRHISQRTYNTAVFIPHSFSSSSARSSAVLLICFVCLCLFQLVRPISVKSAADIGPLPLDLGHSIWK